MGRFVKVCRRRCLQVNAGKNMLMVFGGEEGLDCKVCVDGIRLKHVSEFKYLRWVLDESGTDEVECSREVVSGRMVAGAIRSLGNARCLQLGWARVLDELLLVPVLTYGSETIIWREKESPRIRALQMDNLRGLLGFGRMDKIPDA